MVCGRGVVKNWKGALLPQRYSTFLPGGTELLSLRRTRLGAVLERVAQAAMRLAETESKLLRVEIVGGDYTIDRRSAERLYDALVQLARNAVAHGIAQPQERVASGKRSKSLSVTSLVPR
jgi:chemotaxis protein histidine kinase CheA